MLLSLCECPFFGCSDQTQLTMASNRSFSIGNIIGTKVPTSRVERLLTRAPRTFDFHGRNCTGLHASEDHNDGKLCNFLMPGFLLRCMLVWENKKRDKRNETSPDIQDSEFMNLTDRQNRGFRVSSSCPPSSLDEEHANVETVLPLREIKSTWSSVLALLDCWNIGPCGLLPLGGLPTVHRI
jgi:hypothetical protein